MGPALPGLVALGLATLPAWLPLGLATLSARLSLVGPALPGLVALRLATLSVVLAARVTALAAGLVLGASPGLRGSPGIPLRGRSLLALRVPADVGACPFPGRVGRVSLRVPLGSLRRGRRLVPALA